jgi:hypothetical protein
MNERIGRLVQLLEIELAARGAPAVVYDKLHAMAQNIRETETLDWLDAALALVMEEERRRENEGAAAEEY